MSSGKIVQVIGPVVDVEFSLDQSLPDINNALIVYKKDEQKTKVVLEAALELGDGVIRTIAMESTDGLQRGMEVIDTGASISVPVGTDDKGLPIGMQLIGDCFKEKEIIRAAYTYECSEKNGQEVK